MHLTEAILGEILLISMRTSSSFFLAIVRKNPSETDVWTEKPVDLYIFGEQETCTMDTPAAPTKNLQVSLAVYNASVAILTSVPAMTQDKSLEIAAGMAGVIFDDICLSKLVETQTPDSSFVEYLKR